jgi:uncharacterized protein involved in outer membrane biogenesis
MRSIISAQWNRLKRRLAWLAGVGLLLCAVPVVMPMVLDIEGKKEDIIRLFKSSTGRDIRIDGAISSHFFPFPEVRVQGVSVANAPWSERHHMLTAEEMRIRLGWLGVLSGNPKPSAIELQRPVLMLERSEDKRFNWDGPSDASTGIGSATFMASHAVPLTLHNGAIHYVDRFAKWQASATKVEGEIALAADSLSTDLSFQIANHLQLVWRHSATKASDGGWDVQTSLSSPSGKLHFAGAWGGLQKRDSVKGELGFESSDFPRFVTELTSKLRVKQGYQPSAASAFALIAQVVGQGEKLRLSDVDIRSDIYQGKGSIHADLKAVPEFSVQFADAKVNLDQFFQFLERTPPAEEKIRDSWAVPLVVTDARDAVLHIPGAFDLFLKLGFESLRYKNDVATKLVLHSELVDGEVVLHQASAELPGKSHLTIFGIVNQQIDGPMFEGQMELDGSSARALFPWLGWDIPVVNKERFGPYHLKGGMLLSLSELRLNDTTLEMDGTRAAGALQIRFPADLEKEKRTQKGQEELALLLDSKEEQAKAETRSLPRIRATISVDEWRADQYLTNQMIFKSLELAPEEQSFLSAKYRPISLEWLHHLPFSMDLRMRANHLYYQEFALEDPQMEISMQPGSLQINKLYTNMHGAQLYGDIDLKATEKRPFVTAKLVTNRMDLSLLLPALPDAKRKELPVESLAPTLAHIWRQDSIDTSILTVLDGKLDLSAGILEHPNHPLTNVRLQGDLAANTLNIRSLEGAGLGGTLKCSGNFTGGRIPEFSLSFLLEQIDLAKGAAALQDSINFMARKPVLPASEEDRIAGLASFAGTVRSSGISFESLIGGLESSVNASLRDVRIPGFSHQLFVSKLAHIRSLEDLQNMRRLSLSERSNTHYPHITGNGYIRGGVMQIPRLLLDTDSGQATMQATLDLKRWMLNVQTTYPILVNERTELPPFSLNLSGDISEPKKSLDTRDLEEAISQRSAQRLLQ